MKNRLDQYAKRQKAFWNVSDEQTARFQRVAVGENRSETQWLRIASRDADSLLEGIPVGADWTVLEIGCGVGRIVEQLRQRCQFRHLIGLDVSETMIQFAQKRLGPDERISLFVNDGYHLTPVEDTSVGFAYSVDVFIHIHDAELILHYLRETHRVLQKDGLFRFNVRRFNPDSAFQNSLGGRFAKWMHKLGIWSTGSHKWHPSEDVGFNGNLFTFQEIQHLIKQSGLSIVDIRPAGAHFWCTTRKP